ncbi:hypothetical protein V6245_02700 [Salinibacterium amurskyense]|uniref:hypothetical protein n=1 Tax=Salinibacterium amurskyense TaxID=205941 RepID=UPI00311E18BC
MSALLEFLVLLFAAWLPVNPMNHRARDRRLLEAQKVMCAIRALDGRVLNIGTEWSFGVSEIAERQLKFSPTTGIVGNRTVPVLSVNPIDGDPRFGTTPAWADSAHFAVSTGAGDLVLAFPKYLTSEVFALLFPEPQRTPDNTPPPH